MTYWAVEGCTYAVTAANGAACASGDGATITAAYSGPTAAAIDGSTALCGSVTLSLAGGTCAAVQGVSGAGTAVLAGSAVYVKVDGEAAVLLGDSVEVAMTGVNSATGAAVAWTFTVEVAGAGQSSTLAE